ncbi:MAG: 1-deoxy-D-xylulose-5-phosphate reductoisomerase [Myxococcota bacterium]
MKRLSILGSTGSVGTQTLAVVEQHPDAFSVEALAAGTNVELLAEQVKRFRPECVSVGSQAGADELRKRLGDADCLGLDIHVGDAGLEAVATHAPCDLVVAALVGAVGLRPTLAAIRAGRNVALANKEVMVMAGALVLREVKAHGVVLLPVDSEHNAIFQALSGQRDQDVSRIILTCSGGPFRGWSAEGIAGASVEQALNHPKWDMGDKISIDSASLMNKGLEVIEARWLFDVEPEQIDVVVHPQSIVHSLVEFCDTSVIAQLGLPDMRVPIAVAMAHPERVALDLPSLNLAEVGTLDFEEPDRQKFPCLDLAYRALSGSEEAPAVLNAANEVSVAAFLAGGIPFGAIADTNARVLDTHLEARSGVAVGDIADILAADAWAREEAERVINKLDLGVG